MTNGKNTQKSMEGHRGDLPSQPTSVRDKVSNLAIYPLLMTGLQIMAMELFKLGGLVARIREISFAKVVSKSVLTSQAIIFLIKLSRES